MYRLCPFWLVFTVSFVGFCSIFPLVCALVVAGFYGTHTHQNDPYQKTTCLVLDKFIVYDVCNVEDCPDNSDALVVPVGKKLLQLGCTTIQVECYKPSFEVNYLSKDGQNITTVFIEEIVYTTDRATEMENNRNVSFLCTVKLIVLDRRGVHLLLSQQGFRKHKMDHFRYKTMANSYGCWILCAWLLLGQRWNYFACKMSCYNNETLKTQILVYK